VLAKYGHQGTKIMSDDSTHVMRSSAPACVFQNAHCTRRELASKMSLLRRVGRTQLRSLIDAEFICIDRVKQGLDSQRTNRCPERQISSSGGPGQAIFANCQRTGQAFSARSFKTYDVPPLVSRFRASGDVLSRSFLCNLFLLCGANA